MRGESGAACSGRRGAGQLVSRGTNQPGCLHHAPCPPKPNLIPAPYSPLPEPLTPNCKPHKMPLYPSPDDASAKTCAVTMRLSKTARGGPWAREAARGEARRGRWRGNPAPRRLAPRHRGACRSCAVRWLASGGAHPAESRSWVAHPLEAMQGDQQPKMCLEFEDICYVGFCGRDPRFPIGDWYDIFVYRW
jgi:hypothetical protein